MTTAALNGDRLRGVAELWQRQHKDVEVRFGGVSMMPAIEPGQPLRLLCDDAPLQVDTVVAFVFNEQVVVHRLLAMSRDGAWLVTCGDAHYVPDVPIRAESVIGRIVRSDDSEIAPVRGAALRRAFLVASLRASVPLTRAAIVLLSSARNRVFALAGRASRALR